MQKKEFKIAYIISIPLLHEFLAVHIIINPQPGTRNP